ncbi:MAG: hypothetical protein UU78_C0087G0006 [Candidatus Roizmanbacteria bacterium GW2011_GWC2_41_7]|uniref:HIT domain-containing protein n=1 Tax=Candidatus Roizmanbacteria bacterium GW2011_GWC2_41_7 TaxID=1618487 RepID=A0A0G0X2U8_9BACT|nr:MAG: hypothetical protein UU78_C0087G0006 [Candidatus Roizmanbacteria bacterium GW2011_GWC2_41_7]
MLPYPPSNAIIYEDKKVYVCFASYPIGWGHTVVVWKKQIPDLHYLSDGEYNYLMDMVDIARDALLKVYKTQKVYLLYMDEVKQVHWHLVPRFNEKGVNVSMHKPQKAKDFPKILLMRKIFQGILKRREAKKQ